MTKISDGLLDELEQGMLDGPDIQIFDRLDVEMITTLCRPIRNVPEWHEYCRLGFSSERPIVVFLPEEWEEEAAEFASLVCEKKPNMNNPDNWKIGRLGERAFCAVMEHWGWGVTWLEAGGHVGYGHVDRGDVLVNFSYDWLFESSVRHKERIFDIKTSHISKGGKLWLRPEMKNTPSDYVIAAVYVPRLNSIPSMIHLWGAVHREQIKSLVNGEIKPVSLDVLLSFDALIDEICVP